MEGLGEELQLRRALLHADPAADTFDPSAAVEELSHLIATSPESSSAGYATVVRALLTRLLSQQESHDEARAEIQRLETRATSAEKELGACQTGLERIKSILLEGPSAGQ